MYKRFVDWDYFVIKVCRFAEYVDGLCVERDEFQVVVPPNSKTTKY